MDLMMNPEARPGGAALVPLWLLALLEDSVDTRSSLPIDVLQHQVPGELPKPPLCLFVIRAFTGLIRQALTLVLSHIPAPGVAGQAPLTPIRPPHLPAHAKTRVLPVASGNLMP